MIQYPNSELRLFQRYFANCVNRVASISNIVNLCKQREVIYSINSFQNLVYLLGCQCSLQLLAIKNLFFDDIPSLARIFGICFCTFTVSATKASRDEISDSTTLEKSCRLDARVKFFTEPHHLDQTNTNDRSFGISTVPKTI